ncbi:hypothetical protein LSH36_997g02068 [Paralvinella palmiformis]|uniref:Uncharacterized protein n=1 Tax=Paralvinella palmiformis TaxID=53620 RepID=A0AAD9IWC2_9ANNE|nr:hypothetical protein LSH36_997g02068 [Paralvinella palmiformis]
MARRITRTASSARVQEIPNHVELEKVKDGSVKTSTLSLATVKLYNKVFLSTMDKVVVIPLHGYENISAKCRELSRSPEQELEYVVQGLLPNIQQQVLLKEPSTLSDVKRIALLVESMTPTVTGECTLVFPTTNTTTVNGVSDDLLCIKEQLKTQADQVAALTLQLKRKATDAQFQKDKHS